MPLILYNSTSLFFLQKNIIWFSDHHRLYTTPSINKYRRTYWITAGDPKCPIFVYIWSTK